MFHSTRFLVKAGVLSVAMLLLAAGSSLAQHGGYAGSHFGGGSFGGAGYGGFGGYGGYGGSGYTGSYSSGGYGGLGSSGGVYYGSGWGWGPGTSPYYGYWPGYYGSYSYAGPSGYAMPYGGSAASSGYATRSAATPTSNYQSYFFPSGAATASDDPTCLVEVDVPSATAEVWFNGYKTKKTGLARQFVTPALTPGQTYVYEVRATWMENGQVNSQTRDVRVEPGKKVVVVFE
jgi:uncharacterized protein (TIGR03000 family)